MRRRRKRETDGTQGVDLGIIITPMLDMAFQLLAFFIMTYHPPAREAVVDGTILPAKEQKLPGKGKDVEPEVRRKLRVVIAAVPAAKAGEPLQPGQPKSIALEKPPGRPIPLAVLSKPGAKAGDPPADFADALKTLAAELALSAQNPAERDWDLEIDADRNLRYGYFIAIREIAEASGFKKIGFNAPR